MMNKLSHLQPHVISSTFAYMLIVVGIWSYFDTGANAEFITVILGVVLLIMNNGVQYGTREASYVALITTLLSLIVVGRPINRHLQLNHMDALIRTGILIVVGVTSFFSLAYTIFFAQKAAQKQRLRK